MANGLLTGLQRKKKPLVYHPLPGDYVSAFTTDGVTTGAGVDKAMSYTRNVAGLGGIPDDGRVRALHVNLIGRNTVIEVCTYYVYPYYQPPLKGVEQNPIGATAVGNGNGPGIYFGKSTSVYESLDVLFVETGGLGNTQFKYSVAVGTGAATYYARIMGWWEEAE
jgi:hypothetical protein